MNLAPGSSLAAWRDDSPYANNNGANPSGAASMSLGLFRKPLVSFSGTSQAFAHLTPSVSDSDSFSMFLVGESRAEFNRGLTVSDWGVSLGETGFFLVVSGAQYNALYTVTPADVATNGLVIKSGHRNQPDGAMRFYINGTLRSTATSAVGSLRACTWHDAMGMGVNTVCFAAKYAEVIVYNRYLTETEIGMVHRYLRKRWRTK